MTAEKFLDGLTNLDDDFIREAEKAWEKGKLRTRGSYVRYLAAAAVLAAILTGVFRPAVLTEAAQAVVRWFEDYVSYRFRTETTLKSVPQYELRNPGAEYRLTDEEYRGTMGSAVYQSGEREKSIYFLYGLSDGEVQVPGAGLAYKVIIDADGTELHYVYPETEGQEGSLTWLSEDGQIVFSISGTQSEEELLELRHSVALVGEEPVYEGSLESMAGVEGFDAILANLTESQAWAVWHSESEYPILLVAEGTYEIDGVIAAIYCQVYGLQDGSPQYMGYLASSGTAYPLTWDDEYIYVQGGHFWGRYQISGQSGALCLSDGLSYLPAGEGYSLRRDAQVRETFDENGEPDYLSEGEFLDEESGEEKMLELLADIEKSTIIEFRR